MDGVEWLQPSASWLIDGVAHEAELQQIGELIETRAISELKTGIAQVSAGKRPPNGAPKEFSPDRPVELAQQIEAKWFRGKLPSI